MERDGAGQEWKERACLTSDEFPRGHRRAPIVHARYGGEIRVYRRAADRIRGICAPLSFASPISHRRRRRERNPQKFDCDYRPLRHRFDLARGFSPRFHSDDREGIERADSNRFPSFGRCSFSRDGCASLSLSLFLFFFLERERGILFETSSRGRGVSRSFEETSTRFENAAQRGVLRSGRLGRWVARIRRIAVAVGEATSKKGKERAGRGKKEKHGSGYHDASSRRVRCPRLGRVCARTTL